MENLLTFEEHFVHSIISARALNRRITVAALFILSMIIILVGCPTQTSVIISVTPGDLSLLVGQTGQLAASISPESAAADTILWATSADSVATVDTSGLVTAVGVGTSSIAATAAGSGSSAVALVTVGVVAIEMASASLSLHVGQSSQLSASIISDVTTTDTIIWSTSDGSLATVDSAGHVTAIGVGNVTITATGSVSGSSATALITVGGVNIEVVPTSLSLLDGDTGQLTVSVDPVEAAGQPVTWSSNDATVATVDTAGLVTATGVGGAIISATSVSGSISNASVSVHQAASSVSQYGITWTFDHIYEVGQFVNGDWWVLGPVTIIDIDPGSVLLATRDYNGRPNQDPAFDETVTDSTINGSMINPVSTDDQAYDSAMFGQYSSTFDAANNAARPGGNDLTDTNPLVASVGSSIVSTISVADGGPRPQLTDAAVLTVVDSVPSGGTFRPTYAGTVKTIYQFDDVRVDLLPNLGSSSITDKPDFTVLAADIERPWIDHHVNYLGRYMHPSNNMPDYGRDMAMLLGNASLSVLLDLPNSDLRPLLINLIQIGIDFYGLAINNGYWPDNGGHGHGRKWPILFAGIMLDDSNMIAVANASDYFVFQEDRQTFYVAQSDVDQVRYTADGRLRDPYETADIGLPEWGEKHASSAQRDGENNSAYYREIVSASIGGHVLAAIIMDRETDLDILGFWNWQPLFDYSDRWFGLGPWVDSSDNPTAPNYERAYFPFVESMWDTYRGITPTVWSDD